MKRGIKTLIVLMMFLASGCRSAGTCDEGVIHHPVATIGGETTGVVLVDENSALELEFSGELPPDKSKIKVYGTVREVEGVEVPSRKIMTVNRWELVD